MLGQNRSLALLSSSIFVTEHNTLHIRCVYPPGGVVCGEWFGTVMVYSPHSIPYTGSAIVDHLVKYRLVISAEADVVISANWL